jgi:hypothetical protein
MANPLLVAFGKRTRFRKDAPLLAVLGYALFIEKLYERPTRVADECREGRGLSRGQGVWVFGHGF